MGIGVWGLEFGLVFEALRTLISLSFRLKDFLGPVASVQKKKKKTVQDFQGFRMVFPYRVGISGVSVPRDAEGLQHGFLVRSSSSQRARSHLQRPFIQFDFPGVDCSLVLGTKFVKPGE